MAELNYLQTFQALGEGKRIRTKQGREFYFHGDRLLMDHGNLNALVGYTPRPDEAPFTEVIFSATFDEAFSAHQVRVYHPQLMCHKEPYYIINRSETDTSYWTSADVCLFDLAERRGWLMEVVK